MKLISSKPCVIGAIPANGFSIVISIDSLIIIKEGKRVHTPCWTPPGTLKLTLGGKMNLTCLLLPTEGDHHHTFPKVCDWIAPMTQGL